MSVSEAIEHINQALLTNSQRLYLSDHQLDELPPEIWKLHKLEYRLIDACTSMDQQYHRM